MIITIPEKNKMIRNSDWEPNGIESLEEGDIFTVYASDWKVLHYTIDFEEKSYHINSKWIFHKIISPTQLEVDWLENFEY